MEFTKWIDTFLSEKGIEREDTIYIDTDQNLHIFEVGMVVDAMKRAPQHEQGAIKDMLVKIDFANGDVMDYIRHLAQALVTE